MYKKAIYEVLQVRASELYFDASLMAGQYGKNNVS